MTDVQIAIGLRGKARTNPRGVEGTRCLDLRRSRVADPALSREALGSEIGLDDVAQKISRNGSVGFRGHTKFFERPGQAIRTYFAMRRTIQPSEEKNTLNLILYNPVMLLIKAPHA